MRCGTMVEMVYLTTLVIITHGQRDNRLFMILTHADKTYSAKQNIIEVIARISFKGLSWDR